MTVIISPGNGLGPLGKSLAKKTVSALARKNHYLNIHGGFFTADQKIWFSPDFTKTGANALGERWVFHDWAKTLHGMRIDPEISKILQDTMNRDPEAINRICQEMISRFSIPRAPIKSLTVSEVADATRSLLEKRRSALEEYLNRFTPAEERVLIAFSKQEGREMQPMGKAFLEKSNLTAGGMKKIIDRLLDNAVLYHEKNEYSVADPFVWRHLKEFRA